MILILKKHVLDRFLVDLSQVTSLKVDEAHVDTSNYANVESSNWWIWALEDWAC